jgi:hypothetical protein
MLWGFAWSALASVDAPPVPILEQLQRAKNEYAYGNYDLASQKLQSLLYPMRLESDAQVIEARHYLGIVHFLLDEKDAAKLEFLKLLYLSPAYQLDPFSVAPPIIELFESVRSAHASELEAIRINQRELEAQQKLGIKQANHKEIEPHTEFRVANHEVVTFLPFGIGQFHNGDTGIGLILAVAQLSLLSLNIGSYLWLHGQRVDGQAGYPSTAKASVDAATWTMIGSAVTLGLVWSFGVLHARLSFKPYSDPRLSSRTRHKSDFSGLGFGLEVSY